MQFLLKKIFVFLLMTRCASRKFSGKETEDMSLNGPKIEGDSKSSRNEKRSPLELGFVTFELDRQHSDSNVPALVQQTFFINRVPAVSKSRHIPATTMITTDASHKDHYLIPSHEDRTVVPMARRIHVVQDSKVLTDRKQLTTMDHTAKVIIGQKHLILQNSPQQSVVVSDEPLIQSHPDHRSVVLDHAETRAVVIHHNPVFVDHHLSRDVDHIDYSIPKTYLLHHKPIAVLAHPHPQHKNMIVQSSRTILLSPKSQIHEIIVHRHVPKTIVVHEPNDGTNKFRNHFGGFGVGIDYGGQGAGHGYHVPVF